MPRIKLIPVVTGDGRQIILQAVPQSPRERIKKLVERLRPRRER